MARVDKESPLNDREELFCVEYCKDFNGSRSAIAEGYSEKSAGELASRLLRKVNIQTRIKEIKDAQFKKVGIDGEKVLERLDHIGDVDPAETIDPDTGALLPLHKMPVHVRKAISSMKVFEKFDGDIKIGEIVEVKFWNKVQSNELLGKHKKLFTDVIEVKSDLYDKIAKARARVGKK